MKKTIFFVLIFVSQFAIAQKWKIGIGLHASFDRRLWPAPVVADSLLVIKDSKRNNPLKDSPWLPQIYLERMLLTGRRHQLSAAVSYRERDLNLTVAQFYPPNGRHPNYEVVFNTPHTFLF